MQLVALCVAIFVLVMIDTLVLLAHVMPRGALFATGTDLVVWAMMISLYLTAMATAMYPGRGEPSDIGCPDSGSFYDLSSVE